MKILKNIFKSIKEYILYDGQAMDRQLQQLRRFHSKVQSEMKFGYDIFSPAPIKRKKEVL